MKIKKYLSVLIALSALVLAGCENPAGTGTPTTKNFTVTFKDGETTVKQFTVPEGSKVSDCEDWDAIENYTNPSFDGFHFDGWYSETGTKFADSSVKSDAVYIANWQVIVSFHYWNASDKKNDTTTLYYDQNTSIDNKDIPQIDKKFTKNSTEFTFVYWSTEENAQDTDASTKKFSNKVETTSPVNVYAIYSSKNVYTVSFYSDENLFDTVSVIEGTKVSDYKNVSSPSKEGFKFVGWFIKDTETEFNDDEINTNIDLIAVWKKIYKVDFYKGDTLAFTKEVDAGEKVGTLTSDEKKYNNTNTFLYWSKSKASEAEAKAQKIDIENAVINEDMNVYGIYALGLNQRSIYFSNIRTYFTTPDKNIFTFDDGNIANITVTYSKDGVDKGEMNIISPELEDKGSFYRISFYYDELQTGKYVFSLYNGVETKESTEKDIFTLSAVKNLSITTNDSFAQLSWDNAEGYTGSLYKVEIKNGNEVIYTNANCSSADAKFYGLDNNIEYTFIVTTPESYKNDSIKGTPSITVKEPDWVVAMYMDGDNNLNDPIFLDMNEVEYGLYKIRQELSEDPKAGYSSVAAVALWDGWAGTSGENPYFSNEGSYLYEFGAEKSTCEKTATGYRGNQIYGDNLGEYVFFENLAISSTTKNLSYTAKDWLLSSSATPDDIDENSHGEVNMGDKHTLINYLNWVNAHYKPKKGIILQFSDHGGGPRNAPKYIELPNGTSIKLDDSGRRALCWDEGTPGEHFLKTQDVSDALKSAGYGTSKKLDMIIMDVCLGASIEDSYQFKDYAKYMVASPNTIPGYGLNYIKMMEAFTSTATIEDIGKQIVKDYAHFYGGYNWDKFAQSMSTNDKPINKYEDLSDNQKLYLEFCEGGLAGITTLSFINLQNVATAVTKLNEVAQLLINKKDDILYFTDNTASTLSSTPTRYSLPYIIYARWAALSWPEQEYYDTSMFYQGTYNWLYDISKFADTVMMYSDSEIVGPYADNTLYQAAFELKTALNSVIVSSWRDTKLPGYEDYGFYALLDGVKTTDFTGHSYGLNVAGYGIANNPETGKPLVPGPLYKFYMDDLDFGKNTDWINLLWYMEYYWDTNN